MTKMYFFCESRTCPTWQIAQPAGPHCPDCGQVLGVFVKVSTATQGKIDQRKLPGGDPPPEPEPEPEQQAEPEPEQGQEQ